MAFFKSKIIKPIVHEILNIKDANKAHEIMEKIKILEK